MRCVVLLYIVVCRSENFRFDFREILSWLDLTLANYVSDQFKMKFSFIGFFSGLNYGQGLLLRRTPQVLPNDGLGLGASL